MFRVSCVLFAALLSFKAWSADPTPAKPTPAQVTDPRALIAAKLPGVKLTDVTASPVAGLYEVNLDGSLAYVTADGKYLISGDLYDVGSRTNLTDVRRSATRMQMLASMKEDQMIVFSPKTVKHTITVFTDVDCTYCRKLHSQIAEINKLGIRVRYVAYPRSGPGSDTWQRMEAVWCAKDRNVAFTQAQLGGNVERSAKCGSNPVAKQFALGESFGVRGTPSIVTETGELIGSYLPPDQLAAVLDGRAQVR
jgi:thiol:disulfide interchange protein DsbC